MRFLVIGALCAAGVVAPVLTRAEPAGAPTVAPAAPPNDSVSLARLIAEMRNATPLHCELAVRSADGRTWWSGSGTGAGGPLEVDSSASALIRWMHAEHDPRLVPRLASALRDSNACVRRIAGSMLGRVRAPAARAALLQALDDQEAGTRSSAAIGLGIAEHQPALQPLIARLRDPSPAVRRSAAWALGELEDRNAMLPLIELLGRDGDARVRQAAATAIGKVTS